MSCRSNFLRLDDYTLVNLDRVETVQYYPEYQKVVLNTPGNRLTLFHRSPSQFESLVRILEQASYKGESHEKDEDAVPADAPDVEQERL